MLTKIEVKIIILSQNICTLIPIFSEKLDARGNKKIAINRAEETKLEQFL